MTAFYITVTNKGKAKYTPDGITSASVRRTKLRKIPTNSDISNGLEAEYRNEDGTFTRCVIEHTDQIAELKLPVFKSGMSSDEWFYTTHIKTSVLTALYFNNKKIYTFTPPAK